MLRERRVMFVYSHCPHFACRSTGSNRPTSLTYWPRLPRPPHTTDSCGVTGNHFTALFSCPPLFSSLHFSSLLFSSLLFSSLLSQCPPLFFPTTYKGENSQATGIRTLV